MVEFILGTQDAYRLTEKGEPIEKASDNCNDMRDEITARFDVSKFGSCNHPTAVDADAYALSILVPQVALEGGVLNVESGHRTVEHRSGIAKWKTYLSYAGGDQV